MNLRRRKQLAVLRDQVAHDKEIAREVVSAAREELNRDIIEPVPGDITGTPRATRDFLEYKRTQIPGLQGLTRHPFFAKVDTQLHSADGTTASLTVLVSKQRFVGGLETPAQKWAVVSWTSPITAPLLHTQLGSEFPFQAPRRPLQKYTVLSTARYRHVLPQIEQATYVLPTGSFHIPHERLLTDPSFDPVQSTVRPANMVTTRTPAPPMPPAGARTGSRRTLSSLTPQDARDPSSPTPLSSASSARISDDSQQYTDTAFGLREIIELADADQRATMHLPFHDTLLVEGPPGSGKTSIGLMRIPCLLDRQWEELGRSPDTDPPFHRLSSMRALVLHPHMVDYLDRLVREIGLHGLEVDSIHGFCMRICQDAKTLSGKPTPALQESSNLTRLKLFPPTLTAYWQGFRAALSSLTRSPHWERLAADIVDLDETFGKTLLNTVTGWIDRVCRTSDPSGEPPHMISLPWAVGAFYARAKRLREDNIALKRRYAERRDELVDTLRQLAIRFYNRRRILQCMFQNSEYRASVREAFGSRRMKTLFAEWNAQASGKSQKLGPADFVIGAWLASYVSWTPARDREAAQGRTFSIKVPELTHVMIDEAQDISPAHIMLIKRFLHKSGTITLVGDLHQRLSDHIHFDNWADLDIEPYTKAVFTVNHRQSRPLGEFVRALHSSLYGEPPAWHSSDRPGPRPRVRRLHKEKRLAHTVADEICYWRDQVPHATVGVLVPDSTTMDQLNENCERIGLCLEDSLTQCHVLDGSRDHIHRLTNCAVLARVGHTKGLEFDAVVVVDSDDIWTQSPARLAELHRNTIYVASSRPRHGLSVLLRSRASLLDDSLDTSLFTHIE